MNKSVLLEMQLKEALDREINLKMLNESLMQAMSGMANQDRGKEIHLLNQLHQQELSKLKTTLQEKITILEYEVRSEYYFKHRKKCLEFVQLQKDYSQLKLDYEEKEEQKCLRCVELQYQLSLIVKQNEVEKEGLAHEFADALSNQKSIIEYDLNCLKSNLKDLTYQLDCECKEKDKLQNAIQELNKTHDQAVNSTYRLVKAAQCNKFADLNRSHHETILQNNQYQMNNQQREQMQTVKLSQNEQEKLNLEKSLLEYKEINYKLDSQLKILNQQLLDKETKIIEQKTELTKNNVKLQLSNQKMIFKENSLSQSKILLKKNNNQKPFKLNLQGRRARINFMKNALNQVNLQEIKNATPKQIKHKKNNLSNDYKSSHQPGHQKNTLSQGNIGKIKLQPSTILRSEADSIHFTLTDMLNSTRNIDQQTLSCRQSNDDITYHIDQFNCVAKIIQTNEDSVTPTQILTDRQLSPRIRIQTVNPKGPTSKVRQIQADLSKENAIVRLKS
ncbi:unnamed protein product (macronuclear) [Paramecium tetraurelia]|uniref:Uncharacterized protein n=1 Tax=Paramecium tetraurelia TaxID=5888 RepID=A0BFQ5_PARTE|nr:uncharacterized protein GSPATT00028407001 [Paramecium tetraurelia]CAK57372.1 unnamed protein product [Paramecium tetraurelia]|eukprot:XP_001424770.1 hypothetical protein (macronuclear) [Paramecium tetraurelia strain d4-2]